MGKDTIAAAVVPMAGIIGYLVFVVLVSEAAQKKKRVEAVIIPFSLAFFLLLIICNMS